MNRFYSISLLLLSAILSATAAASPRPQPAISEIERGFHDIPDSTKLAVYWYWLNDNLSAQGVVKDLQSMKKAGINRAYIGFQGIEDVPCGKVKFMSDQWWNVLRTALRTAGDLDIEIGIFNCPGWSQSGGPWVKPEQSMRYLKSVETVAPSKNGSRTIKLPKIPGGQDVAVIAYPAPKKNGFSKKWIISKKSGSRSASVLKLGKNRNIRSVAIKVNEPFNTTATIKAKQGKEWKTLRTFGIDRYNDKLYVGFDPYAPVIISIPETNASEFMLEIGKEGAGKVEVTLHEKPMVERYAEKSLAKMFQEPLPLWGQYMWDKQPEISENGWAVNPSEVIDVTNKVVNDEIDWKKASEDWIISRIAMVSTGVTNSPAMPDATGLEIDKMSKEHLASHFDAFIGEILRKIPESERRTFKIVVEDSYETGGQNWTDNMLRKFEETYGYSPLPYLPALRGVTVGNNELSDRFLWDVRRLVADMVAYEYVGGLREISHKHGLTTWLENYGHWGFPSEFLMYGGQSDEIAGEFWSEGSLGDIENRAAASCGHIYGKQRIWAESCTSGGPVFSRYPAIMKQRVDRFFTEGINATLLHLYIHQDEKTEKAEPGLAAWFGNEFNRKNTWFEHMDVFSRYLKRCNHMLQQGRYIADVAYFIGEDAPKMTGVCTPALPDGYSFDYINAEILRHHSKIVDKQLVLESGMRYKVLVLPDQTTMRPEMLAAIRDMAAAGLTIVGPKPLTSPSLAAYPACDASVAEIAQDMWGNGNEKIRKYGKGLVCQTSDLKAVLAHIGVEPDFTCSAPSDSISFIHRSNGDAEIYFLANPKEQKESVTARFRINGEYYPELWNPATGECRYLPEYECRNGVITVPLAFEPLESAFVVFRKGTASVSGKNYPDHEILASVDNNWTVTFDSKRRGPGSPVAFATLSDWTEHADPEIRNYSGAAVYRNEFEIDNPKGLPCYLSLGKVMVTAKVKINGQYAGGVWTSPYSLNITPYVKPGKNTIEVEVINNWKNRLIGDLSLPEAERSTWTNQQIWKPGDALQPSGLTGPVRVYAADHKIKTHNSADSFIEISNSEITLRQDLRRGGSICYISRTGIDRNIVNIYDEGRYIQQSYYAGKRVDRRHEGQSPSWSPWQWNPIQGGNHARKGARILKCEQTDSTLYVSCVPMLWDMDNHEGEAIMEQWTSINGNTIKVRNRLTCHRTDSIYGNKAVKNDQEIPAIYPISSLKNLYGYFGDKPFKNDKLDNPEVVEIKMDVPGSFWGKYPKVPEKWMAFVDDNMWGMGVFSPSAERFIAGRYTSMTDGEAHSLSTSYIAPLCTSKLKKNSVFEYTYYIVVDHLPEIRNTIYTLNSKH